MEREKDNWISALSAIKAIRFSTICVDHGKIKDGSHFAIQKAYLNVLNDALNAQISDMGHSAFSDKSDNAPARFAKAAVSAAMRRACGFVTACYQR